MVKTTVQRGAVGIVGVLHALCGFLGIYAESVEKSGDVIGEEIGGFFEIYTIVAFAALAYKWELFV